MSHEATVKLALVAVLVAVGGVASAETETTTTLRLRREPPPRHLRMRPRSAAAATTPSSAPSPGSSPAPEAAATAPPTAPTATTFTPSSEAVGLVRDLRRPISARFSMGYVVDGTALTGNRTLDGRDVPSTGREDFRRLRAYAIGEGTFSSRGMLLPSLSTYFAASFQIAQQQKEPDPSVLADRRVSAPVATWFDRTGFQGRSAWLEVKDFLDDKAYEPLRIRGGQLYVYGPWVLHMYGGVLAWDGKLVKLTAYGGSRVPDYTLVEVTDQDRSGIVGASARIDLRALKARIPFAAGVELLQFTARGGTLDPATGHGMLQLDWRPRQDIALVGQARLLDGKLANEHVQLRSRYKQVTNLVFDLTYRSDNDWRWDPSVTNPDPLQARRYLDLGPVVPQLIFSGRAGTLIKENVDVLVRGAVADDRVDRDDQRNTFAARYVEIGGGFEVRLRRTVGVGFTALTRQTKRFATLTDQINDVEGVIEPLPRPYSPTIGERGFSELGTSVRMSLGARRFSALAEAYGRRTRYALTYCKSNGALACNNEVDTGILTDAFRWGGRATIEAWIGSRLRLFASYELSSRIDLAPEISGFKSLRLIMEGVY